jgi:hypothetical protein
MAAAVAATADFIIRRGGFAKFDPASRWLAEFWRESGYVINDSIVVFRVLLHQLIFRRKPASILRRIPFDPGGPTARSAARRALALILTTISPNFIVIGIDEKDESMLIHQIQEAGVPEVTKRLGAK